MNQQKLLEMFGLTKPKKAKPKKKGGKK